MRSKNARIGREGTPDATRPGWRGRLRFRAPEGSATEGRGLAERSKGAGVEGKALAERSKGVGVEGRALAERSKG
jgi:hypothetical protein